jgi:hypothetical protein
MATKKEVTKAAKNPWKNRKVMQRKEGNSSQVSPRPGKRTS